MGLALAVPVWNDRDGLIRLLRDAVRLRCFDEVIVVDDGSDEPLDPAVLPRPAPLRLIRNNTPRGAGQARNRALEVVASSHLLFFDADDRLTRELPWLWRALRGRDFDFCLFRHADSRVSARGLWSEIALDRALWRLSGCGTGALQTVGPDQALLLAETANYPWNKIYRTAFLTNNGLRCAETPVHNDIALHWMSFARAGTILASDRVVALHHVAPDGGRLTNRGGPERLTVFPELARLAAQLGDGPYAEPFLRFCSSLVIWIRGILDPGLLGAFDRAAADFLKTALSPALFERMMQRDPVTALRLVLQMGAAGRP